MKLILVGLIISQYAFSASQEKWVPKYKTQNKADVKNKKTSQAIKESESTFTHPLEQLYAKKTKGKGHLNVLKQESLKLKQNAVPTLIKVMKGDHFPSENRWVATYMLGRIMGVKAAPYIAKFADHKNWMLRLASLKVLLHLNQDKYQGIYARALEDKSLIVRHQALQNIKEMKISALAPYVWKMLYNKDNYAGQKGKLQRSNIIRDAIRIVGDLKFKSAKKPMLEMINRPKFKDIHEDLDYALSKITKKSSPKGEISVKQRFWKRESVKEITI